MGDLRRSESDGVLTLTFTRDQKLNAITEEMIGAIDVAVEDLGNREDLRVLVVTAEGRYFTTGLDVSKFDEAVPKSGVGLRRNYRRLHQLLDEVEEIEKPVIHAAQGPCLGLGVELAVSCDFRFATPRTIYSLPEIANLAVIPGSGGVSRLTRLVGPHRSSWLAMAGEPIDAAQSVSIGLVHKVFDEASFQDEVQAFARRLASFSSEALGLAKLGINTAKSSDKTTARDVDRIANTLLMQSAEHRQAVRAFAQRRR
jgi:enoyl-CoA hydratase/carnithine racemase